MGKRKKSAFRSKEERDAWEAHVDETIARMRGLAEKAWAELQEQKRASGDASAPGAKP